MSPEQQVDVVLTNNVVSFDGRVLELFGHASRTGNRIHVAMITGVGSDGDKIVIEVRGGIEYSIVLADEAQDKRGEVEKVIDQVRSSAPNLQD